MERLVIVEAFTSPFHCIYVVLFCTVSLVSEIEKQGADMKLECPVMTIEHGENGVILNQTISADACILTPSLTVLPELIFIPDLPDPYQEVTFREFVPYIFRGRNFNRVLLTKKCSKNLAS